MCVCHCVTTSKLSSSSAGQESVVEVPLWVRLSLFIHVAGCASQCVVCVYVCTSVCLCVYVHTPLEHMPSLPQAGPANGNGSKQTERKNHLGWEVHQIRIAITELISGSPLLPCNNCGFHTWRWRTCVDIIKLKIKLEV